MTEESASTETDTSIDDAVEAAVEKLSALKRKYADMQRELVSIEKAIAAQTAKIYRWQSSLAKTDSLARTPRGVNHEKVLSALVAAGDKGLSLTEISRITNRMAISSIRSVLLSSPDTFERIDGAFKWIAR